LILLARAAMTAERVLPALWPALGFAGIYLFLALTGLFAFIPWTLQALLLAVTITAIGLGLDAGFSGIQWPRWQDGARRLERDSGLRHRPISESGDRLIGEDPFARSLWQLHQARPLALNGLKVAWPDLDLTRRDPHNLRYLLLLALAGGLVLARGDINQRLSRAFDSGAGANISLDAWIDPPAYTGLAPIYLAQGAAGPIAVPAGAILNLRVHGAAHAPGVSVGDGSRPHFIGDNGEYASNARLAGAAHATNLHLRVRASGHTIGAWNLRVIPDAIPQIAFTAKPARTEHDATQFNFRASDDYGVTSARVVIRPHGKQRAPLIVDLPLAEASSKSLNQTTYSDLTENPYAGLDVDAVLEARDGTGQIGRSQAVTFRLPARTFTDPLARALIEQRQKLATATREDRRIVAETLDAFAIAPDRFYDGKDNIYLALRAAYWATRQARSDADIAHVEALLWQIAISLEQNGLLDAAAQLRQLQALLTAALAAHAPQDVIDALLQKYNQAMQRYMQALQNNPQAPQPQMQSGGNTKTITQDDIQKLMQAIQQMAAAGDRQGAAQMLAFLQNLLENLHMSQSGGGGGQDKSLNDAIQKFGDMMGKQRSLLDKTMRQRQGNGDPKDGGPQGLARQQGELKKELDQMLQSMDPKLKQSMGQAGQSMDNAQRALGGSNLDDAGNEEKNALDSLRKGADALAQQQSQENGQQDGREDPLGRGSAGPGNGVKLPGAGDMAKARGILQELRKRAGERGRPQQELDYIDRLLKEF
jgi:uncharacterized protein (TIGR02302 family)